jgi:hypothetical protein
LADAHTAGVAIPGERTVNRFIDPEGPSITIAGSGIIIDNTYHEVDLAMIGGGNLTGAIGGGTFQGQFFTYAPRRPAGCDEGAIKGFGAGTMVGNVRFRTRR